MKDFFNREIKRYTHRKESMQKKQQDVTQAMTQVNKYKTIIRTLLTCNQSLAKECQTRGVAIDKVPLWGQIYSWRAKSSSRE